MNYQSEQNKLEQLLAYNVQYAIKTLADAGKWIQETQEGKDMLKSVIEGLVTSAKNLGESKQLIR